MTIELISHASLFCLGTKKPEKQLLHPLSGVCLFYLYRQCIILEIVLIFFVGNDDSAEVLLLTRKPRNVFGNNPCLHTSYFFRKN